jgi:signal transduction histidine kinase
MEGQLKELRKELVEAKVKKTVLIFLIWFFIAITIFNYSSGLKPVFYINIISLIAIFHYYYNFKTDRFPKYLKNNFFSILIFTNSVAIFYLQPELAESQYYWLVTCLFAEFILSDIKYVLYWTIIISLFAIFTYCQEVFDFHFYENHYVVTSPFLVEILFYYGLFYICFYFLNLINNLVVIELSKKNKLLEKAQLELVNAQKYKDDFFTKVSHELRTPLITIKGVSNLLQKNPSPEELPMYYKSLNVSSSYLLEIVNDILDISQIEEHKFELENKTFNLHEALTEIITVLENLALEKNLKYECDIKDIPEYIVADKKRISQVIYNLMHNAIKYTNEGFVKITAKLHISQIIIRVSDSGIGIHEQFIEKLYQNFTQEGRDSNSNLRGSGLGLSISYKLATLMGGSISCESKINSGSSFTFSFPYHPPSSKEISLHSQANDLGFDIQLNFLIADDNNLNLMVIQKILNSEFPNSKYYLATDGLEALQQLEKNPQIQIILLDLQMPNLDGYDTASKIRTSNTSVIIFAMSASMNETIKNNCISRGVNEVMIKPFEIDTLKKMVLKYFPEGK